jgi:hypothetical protein
VNTDRATPPRVAFHDLAPEEFPFDVALMDQDTGELLWERHVTGPGVLKVPGFAPRRVLSWIRQPAWTMVNLADGVTVILVDVG